MEMLRDSNQMSCLMGIECGIMNLHAMLTYGDKVVMNDLAQLFPDNDEGGEDEIVENQHD